MVPRTPGCSGNLDRGAFGIQLSRWIFVFPTQMLVKATPTEGEGQTTEFFADQPLGGYTSFIDVSDEKPDMTREIVISSGFLNSKAAPSDPKAFVYAFDGGAFPNVPRFSLA